MNISPTGFPSDLLTQPPSMRLQYFQTYTMAHPRLSAAKDALIHAIHAMPPNSLILVFGPTGVGKTTLRQKIEQILTNEMLPHLATDPGRIPVVSLECIASDSGIFKWRDHFRRLLLEMQEPLVDYKLSPEHPVRPGNTVRFRPGARAAGNEYHHAVECTLRFRRPAAVLLDEAQHLARMASGRRLADQMDVIKSLANRTQIIHILLGTYDLLAFRNLSGQLSRRSMDIHFSRYRFDDPEDKKSFQAVLRSFEKHVPVPEPPDLLSHCEYLYERSIGCVGLLKDWLARTLITAIARNSSTLTYKDLQAHELSTSQCDKILSEALEGEARLLEEPTARSRLRVRLGLSCQEDSQPGNASVGAVSIGKRRKQPGKRHPRRDPIGPIPHATTLSL